MKKAKILFGMVILVLTMLMFTAVSYADTEPYTETNVQDLGDFYSLKTNIYNLTIDAKIIFAAYKDNKMFKVDERDYLPHYATFTNPEYFEIFNIDKGVDYVKVLAFSDFDSIRPLCDAEVIEFNTVTPDEPDELESVKLRCEIVSTNAFTAPANEQEEVRLNIIDNYNSEYSAFSNGTRLILSVGETDISNYVGRIADVYIAYENENIDESYIESFVLDKTNSFIITSEQYDRTTTSAGLLKVEYYENPSDMYKKSFTVSSDSAIYVNGVKSYKTLAADLDSFYGAAEFVLNDSSINADFDTVYITTYETIVVDTVNTNTLRIMPKNNAKTLTYANLDYTIRATLYDTNGNKMDWADLKEFDVVSYTKTSNTATTNIVGYLIDGAVTGMVTEIGDDTVMINDKEYGTTYDVLDEIYMGDEGTFYTDIMGKIMYYEEAVKERNYGYLIRAKVNTTKDVTELFLVPNTVGSHAVRYQAASKVRIDGNVMSDADQIVDTLYGVVDSTEYKAPSSTTPGTYMNVDGSDISGLCPQLVRYSLNTSGEVNMIDTAADGGDLTIFDKNSTATWKYGSAIFKDSKNNTQVKVDSNTYIIFAPTDDRSAGDEYTVKKYSSSLFKTSNTYRIEAYDVEGAANTAKAIVVYGGNIIYNINRETGMFLVTNVSRTKNNDGFDAYKVTGYLSSIYEKGTEKIYYTKDTELPEGIEIGNVIRFGITSKGYIRPDQVQVVLDVSTEGIEPFTTDSENKSMTPKFINRSAIYSFVSGTYFYGVGHGLLYMGVEDDTGSYGYIAPTGTRTKDAVDSVEDQIWMFTLNSIAKFFTYDASQTKEYKVTAHEGLIPLSAYSCYKDSTEGGSDESAELAQEIFVYEGNGQIRMVYIIKR